MTVLISGSMAYDTIMVFPDRFRNHILPEKVHLLNVSFLVPEMRREFGGCAGNIAYNLKLLGGDPHILATVGHDFGPYREWLQKNDLDDTHITALDEHFTGQAFITTDQDDNQITAFHPGAMGEAHRVRVPDNDALRFGIVAPNGRQGMIEHATQLAEKGIPFLFDPGQGLPMFDGEDLLRFLDQATFAAFNDYEAALTAERTGLTVEKLAERVDALIVTHGAKGSAIHVNGRCIDIPAVEADSIQDPTGCGDAYRGAILFGLEKGYDWETTGRMASLLGSIKVAHLGPQNHRFTPEEFADRFEATFGYRY